MTPRNDPYADILALSERACFQIDALIDDTTSFDFSCPFLPERFARVAELPFLSADEQRVLNQVRGHAYLSIFGLVEEFILPFLLDHTRGRLSASDNERRALLQFAGEEAKHIALFRRFKHAFERGFEVPCHVIGPADAIADAVLSHDPLSVALTILHIEWMTQAHYVESVRDDGGIEPRFKQLLRCHWMEEAQHAKLDALIVETLAASYTPEQRAQAVEGYLAIAAILDGGLTQQVEFDISAFEQKTGRVLSREEADLTRTVQRRASRFTYLGSGMLHPKFQATLRGLGGDLSTRVARVAPSFC